VKQRDWENTLQLADYQVATGHVTTYWQPTFLDKVTAQISVGRYLAGDYGATLNFAKKFDSGISAGFFATFTNVSAEEYGEGSFTKGLYITQGALHHNPVRPHDVQVHHRQRYHQLGPPDSGRGSDAGQKIRALQPEQCRLLLI